MQWVVLLMLKKFHNMKSAVVMLTKFFSSILNWLHNSFFSMALLIDYKIFFIGSIRVVLISDTHSQHERLGQLPPGELLIHAGIRSSSSTLNVWQILNFNTYELIFIHMWYEWIFLFIKIFGHIQLLATLWSKY